MAHKRISVEVQRTVRAFVQLVVMLVQVVLVVVVVLLVASLTMHFSYVAVEKGIIGKLFGAQWAADLRPFLGLHFDEPGHSSRGAEVCARRINESLQSQWVFKSRVAVLSVFEGKFLVMLQLFISLINQSNQQAFNS